MISHELNEIDCFSDTNGEIDLTPDNVYIAETVFSIYYKNSKLKDTFKSLERNYCKKTLEEVCTVVNQENSTHLRKYEKTIIVNSLYVVCPDIHSFKNELKDEKYSLVDKIVNLKGLYAKDMIENYQTDNDKDDKVRNNYSFATKLCHYACYYLFNNDKDRDRYPIYDSVLAKYVKKSEAYNSAEADEKDISVYKNYVTIVDRIIEGKGISRNGFDHLIWLATRETV